MKITRDSRKVDKRKLAKAEANKGCDICPCCGETKSIFDYIGYVLGRHTDSGNAFFTRLRS